MCLVCGHVGCGRFSGRHAHAHFEETGHTFAFELESQRVWDYAGDQYVHRLIQSKTDGKLVELPSSAASGPGSGHKNGPHGAAGDEIAKIEAISIEFSDLLTTQLDSQRSYFAEKVSQLKEDLQAAEARRETATSAAKRYEAELEVVRKQQETIAVRKQAEEYALRTRLKLLEEETIPEMERDRSRLEKKLEKATELARTFQKDLQEERTVSKGLLANMAKLKEENEQRKAETDSLKTQVQDLNEQVQDLMFTLTAQAKIAEEGGEGGDVQLVPQQTASRGSARRGGRRR
jgi:BRCA1-associated protein